MYLYKQVEALLMCTNYNLNVTVQTAAEAKLSPPTGASIDFVDTEESTLRIQYAYIPQNNLSPRCSYIVSKRAPRLSAHALLRSLSSVPVCIGTCDAQHRPDLGAAFVSG